MCLLRASVSQGVPFSSIIFSSTSLNGQTISEYSAVLVYVKSRDSAVGIASGYGLGVQGVGVRIPVGARIFISPRPTHSRIQWVKSAGP
jgi:hypothetical protein